MKSEYPSKDQQLSSTTINTLPQTIIETILCLLPIKEAARTSILSTEWRYKWTTIPKLDFGWGSQPKLKTKENQPSDITSARKNMDPRCKLFNAIHQVLLMRQAPINEFTFYSYAYGTCFELDQIIFHLSRNHALNKLTLMFDDMDLYKLPLCAFSLHQLTDLHLIYVDLSHKPISNGFGSLRKLRLLGVKISTKALLHLLSNCPSLKSLWLLTEGHIGSKDCTFVELFECLPVIEELVTWGDSIYPWLVLDSVPKRLPTSLIHLKYFCFNDMCFADDHGLNFLVVVIKCSPNLEKLELELIDCRHNNCYVNDIRSSILEKYPDVWLENLKEFKIRSYTNLKEMELLKFILARSSKLKKVSIESLLEKDEDPDMLKTLLQATRASPVEIIVKYWGGSFESSGN